MLDTATNAPPSTPLCANIAAAPCFNVKKAPVRLESSMERQASRPVSTSGPRVPVPADMTTMSRRPSGPLAAFTAVWTAVSSATSPAVTLTPNPSSDITVCAAASRSMFRPMIVTRAPSLARWMALASPMPDDPPVMSA